MRKSESTVPDLLEQMGYDTRDISLKGVFFWIGVLFVFIAVTTLVTIGIYALFIPNWAKLGNPSPIPAGRRLPPHPQLQIEPRLEMSLYRQAEDRVLRAEVGDGSGPKPALSIDQAIELMATDRGIAGVKGTEVRSRGTAYPGSGVYETAPDAAPAGTTNGGEK